MSNYDFGSIGSTGGPSPYSDEPSHRSVFSLVLTIVVIAVAASVGLGVAFWAVGLVFHLFGWILRIALLAGVAAFVWRWVNRRTSH
jgi:hypothetical protein